MNSVPFIGRTFTLPMTHDYFNATSINERISLFLSLLITIIVLTFGHYSQAVFGFNLINVDLPYALNIIFALYFIINSLVIVTQLHLLLRIIIYLPRKLPKNIKTHKGLSLTSKIIHTIFTLICQGIFLAAYYASLN